MCCPVGLSILHSPSGHRGQEGEAHHSRGRHGQALVARESLGLRVAGEPALPWAQRRDSPPTVRLAHAALRSGVSPLLGR
jgi:hypothetical protein